MTHLIYVLFRSLWLHVGNTVTEAKTRKDVIAIIWMTDKGSPDQASSHGGGALEIDDIDIDVDTDDTDIDDRYR